MLRTRVTSSSQSHRCTNSTYTGPGKSTSNEFTGITGSQERCIDEINYDMKAVRGLRKLKKRGVLSDKTKRMLEWLEQTRDLGGQLNVQKLTVKGGGNSSLYKVDKYGYGYSQSGVVFPKTPVPISSLTYLEPSSDNELFVLGGPVIKRAAPTNPYASTAVMLKELLTEGIPSLPGLLSYKTKVKDGVARTASGEYLNIEFGWKPLLMDLERCFKAINGAHNRLRDFFGSSGKPVHRARSIRKDRTVVSTDLGMTYPWPAASTSLYTSPGRLVKTVITTHDQWFSGVFKYAAPGDTTALQRTHRELEKLRLNWGLDLDPVTVYNMIPWTWLVDWVFDFSSVLGLLSNFMHDGLVLQYGYLMEHKVETTTWSMSGCSGYGTINPGPLIQIRECKRRVKASPFGFGINTEAFTPRQWAILAALGFTKAPR